MRSQRLERQDEFEAIETASSIVSGEGSEARQRLGVSAMKLLIVYKEENFDAEDSAMVVEVYVWWCCCSESSAVAESVQSRH